MGALPTSTGCVTGNVWVAKGPTRLRGRAHAARLESEDRGGSEGENVCTQKLTGTRQNQRGLSTPSCNSGAVGCAIGKQNWTWPVKSSGGQSVYGWAARNCKWRYL